MVVVAAGAALVWRGARRREPDVPLRRSVVAVAGLSVVAVGLAWSGARSYGDEGVPLVAAAGDLPVLPFNPIASRASLVLAVSMLVWATGARRRPPVAGRADRGGDRLRPARPQPRGCRA